MLAGGIVMVSFAPIALLVAGVATTQQSQCERGGEYRRGYDDSGVYQTVRLPPVGCDDYDKTIYASLVSAVVLGGGGITFIIVGSKKVPVTGRITPWTTANSAGLGLRVDL
jgi:hypothetical protein